jgi:hypothetical protein
MKNITELRDNLTSLYADLKSGAIEPKMATEMNNTAGKIIGTLKVELDYAEQRKVMPSIAFLDKSDDQSEPDAKVTWA